MTTPQPPHTPGTPDPWSNPHQANYPPQPPGPLGTPGTPGTPAAADPWSNPHQASYPPQPPYDVLTAGPQAFEKRRRGRTPVILVAVATVVALLLGGGAYAGIRMWNGSGAQPEDATPANVVAFARVDLSPGYGQKLKINTLLKKFPQRNGEDAVEELIEGIFDTFGIDEESYNAHVKPWFGERVGVALWLDDAKRPYGLIVLAADDEAAARDGLAQLQRKDGEQKFGFHVQGGFALVAKGTAASQDAAEAAAQDLAQGSLAESAQFHSDVSSLPDRQTVLAWGDLTRAGTLLESVLRATPGGGITRTSPQGLLGGILGTANGTGPLGAFQGRVVLGARATDDGVEIRFHSFDMVPGAQQAAGDVRSVMDALPGNSIMAGSFQMGPLGDSLKGLLPDAGRLQPVPDDVLEGLPPEEAERLREQIEQSRSRYTALSDAVSAIGGAKISIALSNMDDPVPGLAAAAETTSPEKAAALADAAKLAGDEVTVTTSGRKVELKTKGYTAGGGTLADQSLYREAMSGAPKSASVMVYLDFQRVFAGTDMTEQDRQDAKALKALGIAAGLENGDGVGLIRLVIK